MASFGHSLCIATVTPQIQSAGEWAGMERVTVQWQALRAGSSPVPDALQMVFYIEACESGSMMNHLPDDINGRY